MNTTIPITVDFANEKGLDLVSLGRSVVEQTVNTILDEMCQDMAESEHVYRNGYRKRQITCPIGTLTFKIPKLRMGYFSPDDVLGRYTRSDKALMSLIRELYVCGISTRKIEKLAKTMGVEKLSASTVSSMCKELDNEIEVFTSENIDGLEVPYIWLDGTYIKVREGGVNGSMCMVVAVGCDVTGRQRILGFEAIDTESYDGWEGFLRRLQARGIKGVKLVVSDAHAGLKKAISEVFMGASWQRCIFHLIKNAVKPIHSKRARKTISKLASRVFDTDNPHEMRARYHELCEILEKTFPKAAEILSETEVDMFAHLIFPKKRWKRIRTNNVCERMNREIKRRSNVVQVFPNMNSLMRLVGSVLIDISQEPRRRSFMSLTTLEQIYDEDFIQKRESELPLWLGPIPEEVQERSLQLIRAEYQQLMAA